MASGCGGDSLALELFSSMTADYNVDIPDIDFDSDEFKLPPKDGNLYDDIAPLTLEELTTKVVNGDGAFDGIMTALNAHLDEQYRKNRITGKEYADVYVSVTTAALSAGIQFLLGKDQAYWSAVQAQLMARRAEIEAVTVAIQNETAKAQYGVAVAQLVGEEANYALTKLKLSTEDATYCHVKAQTDQALYQVNELLPAQKKILDEQYETARSQTTNTRSDGQPINGTVGAQVTLYGKQANAFDRDIEYKIAKLYMDQWVAQKAIDEGLPPPPAFANENINTIFSKVRANADLS